jgi:FO synthase
LRDWADMNAGEIMLHLAEAPLAKLMGDSEALTIAAHGPIVTYSRKVFIPLTKLCRDVCSYCTFATTPRHVAKPYLDREEVLDIARAGEAAGCREALFTLGDRPEARYPTARRALEASGHSSTLDYLRTMAKAVLDETSLLPHLNPGIMAIEDLAALRPVSVSMGIMLESTSARLAEKGGPHFGSPDKQPDVRLATIEEAGRARIPLTTGLLIGIGETREERIEALIAIRDLQARHGHIQEVIIQNFRAKPGTKMARHAEPTLDDHLWTIAAARLILGADMTIQAPPNLHDGAVLASLLRAGVNDWGGVSPVTPDHVNPEAAWPQLDALARTTRRAGRELVERLAIGPRYAAETDKWVDASLATRVRRTIDGRGLPKTDDWVAGAGTPVPDLPFHAPGKASSEIAGILARLEAGLHPTEADVTALFCAEGRDIEAITSAANRLRMERVGDTVTYVVNRNINYTNICLYKCGFCGFSKGSIKAERGPAYRLDFEEIGRRAFEAVERGATEVCLQGGIHPDYDGTTYLDVLAAVRAAAPAIHIHAFSPLEVTHGARTLGLPVSEFLAQLKAAGLSTLPGTAAEILHPDIRAMICPDKISAQEWIDVMRAAHGLSMRTTATIMFGHVEQYRHWAAHLLLVRALQEETGGFTEFVPLPFVHMEAPIWRKGKARSGPSYRESLLMHAIARLALDPLIPNIQVSWVKMGPGGARAMLNAGANDLGGVLMDESITRSAGGRNGQIFDAEQMIDLAASIGRHARQRNTTYGLVQAHAKSQGELV